MSATDTTCNRAHFARLGHRAQHVGSPAARGNPDEHVPGAESRGQQIARPSHRIVLTGFGRPRQGRLSSRDQAPHQSRGHVEGRRAFGGVEHAHAAAGPGTHIVEMSATAEYVCDRVHRQGDPGDFPPYRPGNLGVRCVDEPQNHRGRERIELRGAWIGLFREKIVQHKRRLTLLYLHGFEAPEGNRERAFDSG